MRSKTILFKPKVLKKRYPKKQDPKTEREKLIIKAYLQGMPTPKIIRVYHIGYNSLYTILDRNHISTRVRTTHKDRVIELLKQKSMTGRQLADNLKISYSTLRTNIGQWELKRHPCPCGQAFIYEKIK